MLPSVGGGSFLPQIAVFLPMQNYPDYDIFKISYVHAMLHRNINADFKEILDSQCSSDFSFYICILKQIQELSTES
jgi:hypothetical protein